MTLTQGVEATALPTGNLQASVKNVALFIRESF
jgi:hypothetical protein